jgi:patatin-like phospholipase/acyl hydrolase
MDNKAPKSMRRLRLLSLDGGGVRGLSSIMILKDIMKALNHGLEQPLEPWQVFDMIGGKPF